MPCFAIKEFLTHIGVCSIRVFRVPQLSNSRIIPNQMLLIL